MPLARYRALLAGGGRAELGERSYPLIPPGHVLVKVLYTAWTGVEEYILQPISLTPYGTVVGHTAAGIVAEAGQDAWPPPGARVAVTRAVEPLPGLETDGYAAEYAVARADSLEPLDGRVEPLHALSLPASLACDTVAAIEAEPGVERVLVLGGGVYGAMTAMAAADAGYETHTIGAKPCTPQAPGAKPRAGRRSAVVAATPDAILVSRASRDARLLVIHPYLQSTVVHTSPGATWRVHVPGGVGGCWRRLLERYWQRCRELVRVVHGLAVPPPLSGLHAYIIDLAEGG